jgi:ribonuclease D
VKQLPRIVDSLQELEAALPLLQGELAVDTEFHAERRFVPELMWIQVADRSGRCLLIDAQVQALLGPTVAFLVDRDLILHAGHHDLALFAPWGEINSERVFDTQLAAGLLGLGYPTNLGRLLGECLDLTIGKKEALSDWSCRPPTAEQMHYAAADVLHLHELADALRARPSALPLQKVQSSLLTENRKIRSDDTLWKDFRAAGVLDAQGREVLKRGVVWRIELARQANRQPRQICPDGALVDLAKRKPRNLEALAAPRNFSKKVRNQHGQALLDCVTKARHPPKQHLPQALQTSHHEQALGALLGAWAHHIRHRLGLELRLVLPDDLRKRLAAQWVQGESPQFPAGWRASAFQGSLDDLTQGRFQTGLQGLEPK